MTMSINVTINQSAPETKFYRHKEHGGAFHLQNESSVYCLVDVQDYFNSGSSYFFNRNTYEPIPDPFAPAPQTNYQFPVLMKHKIYGGVFLFVNNTSSICIDDGGLEGCEQGDSLAMRIELFEIFTGSATIKNA